jgi:hypothetical protein
MGLLDDAIRDHLELKRRRGADPAEVAREQREALDMEPEPVAEFEPGGVAADVVRAAAADGEAAPGEEPGVQAVAGETAELDMRTVLDEGAGASDGVDGEASAHARAERSEPAAEEDSLEWETPVRTSARPSGTDAGSNTGEPADDVLEETPEFLRDTPEQERMWFEQRPPRDFDFDK